MIETTCSCGQQILTAETAVGRALRCKACGHVIRLAAAEAISPESALGDFDARLLITAGPDSVGDCIVLGGISDIEIGKVEGKQIILPGGTMVSRAHAKLVRIDFGPSRWKIVDTQSRNGVFVNGHQVHEADLNDRDVIQIGEYKLQYTVGIPDAETTTASPGPGAVVCKGCGTTYPANTVICTTCGVNIKTGRPLVTSKEFDRDDVEKRIRIASYPLPFFIAPIASEGFGTKKPIAIWVITGITVAISVFFLFADIANFGQTPPELKNAKLWVGSSEAMHAYVTDFVQKKVDEQEPGDARAPARRAHSPFVHDEKEHAVQQKVAEVEGAIAEDEGQFHWYQLLTHALLHASRSHLAGNMLFLLVFGLPVNEVLGNLKTAIVYPLLAICAGGIYAIVEQNQPLHPMVGASGAIMGLAGMYFVLFPVQRMHMAIWLRLWLLIIRPITFFFGYKTWRMRGFWLLLLWVGFNDILPTVLSSKGDHVAHWAHLGGFISGIVIALGLLLTRQIHAHGGDILSVTLGSRAWALIGKPDDREAIKAPVTALMERHPESL
jgi:membrane associated rhomboid family serine protease/pSer/pThr/pTyr-binding forkhead associated (FHA) protein